MTVIMRPNPRFKAAMAEFEKALGESALDASDFKVLVGRDAWRSFTRSAIAGPAGLYPLTKVTLGKIDFVPAD